MSAASPLTVLPFASYWNSKLNVVFARLGSVLTLQIFS